MKLLLSLVLTLAASSAFCQTSSPPAKPAFRAGQPVTLTWAQLTRTVRQADSLSAVAVGARKSATRWQFAALAFRGSRDSAKVALTAKIMELDRSHDKVVDLNRIIVSDEAKVDKFKARAHRKGWVIGLLITALSGLAYVHVTH